MRRYSKKGRLTQLLKLPKTSRDGMDPIELINFRFIHVAWSSFSNVNRGCFASFSTFDYNGFFNDSTQLYLTMTTNLWKST